MQSIRTGQAQRDGLVSDMDPDAINRGDGAGLAGDDAVSSYKQTHFCSFSSKFRVMKKACFKRCMDMFVQGE